MHTFASTCLCCTLIVLFRVAELQSGNMAVPLPMAPLRAWVLNGTWDPNFVLASSDIIHAENKAAVLLGALPSADGVNKCLIRSTSIRA